MTVLIGLMGKARVGKDTAANALVQEFGFSRYAFADPLKNMLTAGFGDLFHEGDREQVIKWLGKSPRQLMQTLGTEWGRNLVHPDLWVLMAEQRWKAVRALNAVDHLPSPGLVVTDVRFDNEAAWIKQEGGLLVEIVRDAAAVNDHISERAVTTEPDVRIRNSGTILQLEQAIISVAKEAIGGC